MTDAKSILGARVSELEIIDNDIIGEVMGVAQAIGALREALDALDRLLDDRKFEKAAALEYGDIASAFVFLRPRKPSSWWTKGRSYTDNQIGPLKWGVSVGRLGCTIPLTLCSG